MGSLRVFLAGLGLGAMLAGASAQSYSVSWYSIDGGGGPSAGGSFVVSGTAGQPDAGTLSGGGFSVTGGFWAVLAAIQTPGAPKLSVERTATNTVVISWPRSTNTWILSRTGELSETPVTWNLVNTARQTNATSVFVIEPLSGGKRFYRLSAP